MNIYETILEKIFSLSKGKEIRSLSNIEKLCELFNHPEHAFRTIHVAGTNGKGSVCTKIATALQAEGYVTGLYTSPHISCFRERIQVNGEPISEEAIVRLFSEIKREAPFFEITTLLAFLYFREKKVDIAVMETGLGGKWDATNVIHPLVSVITSIGYDHVEILGPTLTDIAREKAGIIKRGTPVVLGPDVPFAVMKERADELGSPLYQSKFQSEDFDQENQETARLALKLLSVSEKSIEWGLQAKPPCRFEHYFSKKEIIFDVAHNSHGFARLLQRLQYTYPNHDYRFVVGFSKGKNISECARLLQGNAVHLVSGLHPRLATTQELAPFFPNPIIENSIHQGIDHALEAYNPKPEVIVIAGSFFIMEEAKASIFKNKDDKKNIRPDFSERHCRKVETIPHFLAE